jgi:hypothetical protein
MWDNEAKGVCLLDCHMLRAEACAGSSEAAAAVVLQLSCMQRMDRLTVWAVCQQALL